MGVPVWLLQVKIDPKNYDLLCDPRITITIMIVIIVIIIITIIVITIICTSKYIHRLSNFYTYIYIHSIYCTPEPGRMTVSRPKKRKTWSFHGGLDVYSTFRRVTTWQKESGSGWWLGHPSEKYESQLGWWATQLIWENTIDETNHQPGLKYWTASCRLQCGWTSDEIWWNHRLVSLGILLSSCLEMAWPKLGTSSTQKLGFKAGLKPYITKYIPKTC